MKAGLVMDAERSDNHGAANGFRLNKGSVKTRRGPDVSQGVTLPSLPLLFAPQVVAPI